MFGFVYIEEGGLNIEAVLIQLLAIGVPPDVARHECDAMLPLTITATTPYPNRLSLQAHLKDYAWIAEIFLAENQPSLSEINARLADNIVTINGKYDFPCKAALKRLTTP